MVDETPYKYNDSYTKTLNTRYFTVKLTQTAALCGKTSCKCGLTSRDLPTHDIHCIYMYVFGILYNYLKSYIYPTLFVFTVS